MNSCNGFSICIPYTETGAAIYSDSSDFIYALRKCYEPYVFAHMERMREVYEIIVDFASGFMRISKGSKSRTTGVDVRDSVSQVCGILQCCQRSVFPWNLYHGAAINVNGKTLVLLGSSGAGKTTAIAYLLELWKESVYLSEDVLIIDSAKNRLFPFPRPIHMREDGLSIIRENCHLPLSDAVPCQYGNYCRYLIERKQPDMMPYPICCYIKLQRDGRAEQCRLKRTDGNITGELISSCYSAGNIRNNFLCSAQLSGKIDLFEIRYSELGKLADKLKQLI